MKNLWIHTTVWTVILAVLVGASSLLGYSPAATVARTGQMLAGSASVWLLVVVLLAAFGFAWLWDINTRTGWVIASIIVGALLVGTVITVPSESNRRKHDVAHAQVTKVVTQVNASAPAYEPREPFALLVKRLERSIGDQAGVSLPETNIWRFEVDGVAQTCGLTVAAKKAWTAPVRGVICVSDAGKVTKADFEGTQVPSWLVAVGDLRLQKAVNKAFFGGRYTSADVYGYITKEGPHMVVPVTTRQGGTRYHEGWAGALVFGPNGKVTKVTDPSKVPGPVTGASMADEVLDHLGNRGRFMEMKRNLKSFDLGSGGKNDSQFLLTRSDGKGERLVTLLTPKGSSQTVSAILEINPHKVIDGWPEARLYTLRTQTEDGQSRSSVEEAVALVRSRYGAAMQLAEARNSIAEATPYGRDELIVTVGSDQRVFARVKVNMMTRTSCVYTAEMVEVRCDKADAAPLPISGLAGLFGGATSEENPEADPTAVVPAELSAMTEGQLAELLSQIAEELQARSGLTG